VPRGGPFSSRHGTGEGLNPFASDIDPLMLPRYTFPCPMPRAQVCGRQGAEASRKASRAIFQAPKKEGKVKPGVFLNPGLEILERTFLNGRPKSSMDYLMLEVAWRDWVQQWGLVVEARLVINGVN